MQMKNIERIRFEQLKAGNIFEYNRSIFMRIHSNVSEPFLAVRFYADDLVQFSGKELVAPLHGKLMLKPLPYDENIVSGRLAISSADDIEL